MLKNQKGSAAITAMMAVMILAALGGAFAMLTAGDLAASGEFQNGMTAQYAAEAGANAALAMFDAAEPDWDALVKETAFSQDCSYQVAIAPALTGAGLPVPGGVYQITATGKYRRAVKIVKVSVTRANGAAPTTAFDWR